MTNPAPKVKSNIHDSQDFNKNLGDVAYYPPNPPGVEPSFQWPDKTPKGKPKKTIENQEHFFDQIGINVRFNVISKTVEIKGLTHCAGRYGAANDAVISEIKSIAARYGAPFDSAFVDAAAHRNPYSPVLTLIESKPHDARTDHIKQLCDTIKVKPDFSNELKEIFIRKWFIGAVAMARNDDANFWLKGVLTLQGDQEIGKTTWFNRLMPDSHQDLIQDGVLLYPDQKDSILTAISHWLIELGELDATFRKADIARIKSFITHRKDIIRLPYGKREAVFPRRTAFFASVNPVEFLRDATGNSRFWVIPCHDIDHQHRVDMQQAWAQAHDLFMDGHEWHLTDQESGQRNFYNINFQEQHPISERIQKFIVDRDYITFQKMEATATDVLNMIGYLTPKQQDLNIARQALLELVGEPKRKHKGRMYDLTKCNRHATDTD